jgi:hypothetical protein
VFFGRFVEILVLNDENKSLEKLNESPLKKLNLTKQMKMKVILNESRLKKI